MTKVPTEPSSFLSKLNERIFNNLNNAQFGVAELAAQMSMSRSNLHRKLQRETGKSISQYVREFRLKEAHRLLKEGNANATEVAHAVGFGSVSYFSKSFSEHFGYSPSKAMFKKVEEKEHPSDNESKGSPRLLWLGAAMIVVAVVLLVFSNKTPKKDISLAESSQVKSVYVMPIKNLSEEKGNQYLAVGIQDALNRHFADIEEINLLSPYAFDPSLEEASLIEAIGQKQENILVLMGSLQRYDYDLRLEFRLIDPSTREQLWAKKYDQKAENLLNVQDEIATSVVSFFNGKSSRLSNDKQEEIIQRKEYDPIAYDYYLKGWYYGNSDFSSASLQQAFKYAQMALDIDSTLAPAHDIIAVVYLGMATASLSKSESMNAFKMAEFHIKKAIVLDSAFPALHGTVGFMELYKNWDFYASEQSYEKGLARSNDPLLHFTHVNLLLIENRFEEALKAAFFFDKKYPFYPISAMVLSSYFNGDIANAKQIIKDKLFKHPNNYVVHEIAAFLELNTGEYENVLNHCEEILKLTQNRTPKVLGFMGAAYAHKGDIDTALELLNELTERKKQTDAGAPAFFAGIVSTALGEHEKALDWLEIAVEDHEMEVPWLVSEPQLYPLHGHPRFDALAKKVGFREHAYPIELPRDYPLKQVNSNPLPGP